MMLGALASALGAATAGLESGSWFLLVIAALFVVVGVARNIDMLAFSKTEIGDTDVETAVRWEWRATVGAAAIGVLYGVWSLFTFVFVNTAISELACLGVSVSVLVGVTGRNFAIDRLVSLQVALIGFPLALGMLFDGSIYTVLLAVVLLAFFVGIRKITANIRALLLKAVHGRIEASRLAVELDTALETMQHGLCMLDESGLIAIANDRAEITFSAFVSGKWSGRPFAAMIAAAAARGTIPQRSAENLLAMVNGQRNGKVILRLPNSEYCEVTVSSRQSRTVLLFEDITDRVKAEERINFMAHFDALTGLPNRAFFAEQVEADLERRRLNNSSEIVMLMIVDVDDFKHVNDTMGHLIGDRLLVDVSARLSKCLGKRSTVARLGGDEFIVYRGVAVTEADTISDPEAIFAAFKAPFEVMGESLTVNVSVGVVASTSHDDDLDALMTKADLALYKAKGNGKAQAQVFHAEMDTDYRYRQRLKSELKLCVEAGGLTLAFQPLIDLHSRRVVACEALARWHHPTLGSIPPSLFIPIAEETGLISEISRWVLKTATAECRNWPDDISVSVNISARDFRNADVEAMVLDVLKEFGSGAASARDRGDRNRADRGTRGGDLYPLVAGAPGHWHCARRFRHRLFVIELSAGAALHQAQDRPQLRDGHRDQPQVVEAAAERCPARQGHQPDGHRRGRRNRGAAGTDLGLYQCRPDSGLSVRRAAAAA